MNVYFWACPFVKTSGQVVRFNLCSTSFHRGFPLPPFMQSFDFNTFIANEIFCDLSILIQPKICQSEFISDSFRCLNKFSKTRTTLF